MPHALQCKIKEDASSALHELRLAHLEYIAAHQGEILFGGPTRDESGGPETMIIVLKTDDRATAESFIAAEPYNHSGRVFREVAVRRWAQVVPPLSPTALEEAIAGERAAHGI